MVWNKKLLKRDTGVVCGVEGGGWVNEATLHWVLQPYARMTFDSVPILTNIVEVQMITLLNFVV